MVEALQAKMNNVSHKPSDGGSWRGNPEYYRSIAGGWRPGEIDVSVGRHGTGRADLTPGASSELRTRSYQQALSSVRRLEALASALLYAVHPELYLQARRCLAWTLRSAPEADSRHLQKWGSVFTVLDLIVNRETPLHRDTEPPAGWLDFLMTIGSYQECHFAAPTIGQRFYYPPGTVLGLNSSRILHGASAADGERACLVFYLRQHVARFFGTERVGELVGGVQLRIE